MSRTKVKIFDRINMAADIAFLAHCSCKGDVCNCSHDGQDLFHTLSASNNKGSEMSILEKMAAAGIKLEDLAAAAHSLPPADVRVLVAALTDAAKSSGRDGTLASCTRSPDKAQDRACERRAGASWRRKASQRSQGCRGDVCGAPDCRNRIRENRPCLIIAQAKDAKKHHAGCVNGGNLGRRLFMAPSPNIS
jgi:hypothetical protein